MGLRDEFHGTRRCVPTTIILQFHSVLLFYLAFFYYQVSSGARPALPMGVAPEAIAECLHLGVGSTLLFYRLYIFSLSFSSYQQYNQHC